MGVSKHRGTPKLDGENNGKPLLEWMIWGENPTILGNPHIVPIILGALPTGLPLVLAPSLSLASFAPSP